MTFDGGFDNADRVFEGTFATQLAHHGYLEPHSCTVAVDKSGNVEVWASNKGPFALKNRLAQDLEIEPEKVNVHILSVGGDFGGKASMIDTPVCATTWPKKRAGRCAMVLTYTEEIATAAHRHPAIVSLRVGVKNDGTLTAVDGKVTFAGGAYAAWKANPEITVLGAKRLASYYRIPAIRIEDRLRLYQPGPVHPDPHPGEPTDRVCGGVADGPDRPGDGHRPGGLPPAQPGGPRRHLAAGRQVGRHPGQGDPREGGGGLGMARRLARTQPGTRKSRSTNAAPAAATPTPASIWMKTARSRFWSAYPTWGPESIPRSYRS